MPGRKFNTPTYRYGFNGKETDVEVSNSGDAIQDYGMRIYDPRLGKFLSMDPIISKFAFYSPYQFAGNKPIVAIDLDGLEPVFVHGTFSSPNNAWSTQFKKQMSEALGYESKDMIDNIDWGGDNNKIARETAADKIVAELINPKKNPLSYEKYAVLIGHSHGGNVNKLVKKKLIALGWTVDMINIETPQRTDYVSPKGNGININFYSEADLVQFFGSISFHWGVKPEMTWTNTGRIDPNAFNIRLFEFTNAITSNRAAYEKPFIEFGHSIETNIPKWFDDNEGHSLQNNFYVQSQILNVIKNSFKGRRESVKKQAPEICPAYN